MLAMVINAGNDYLAQAEHLLGIAEGARHSRQVAPIELGLMQTEILLWEQMLSEKMTPLLPVSCASTASQAQGQTAAPPPPSRQTGSSTPCPLETGIKQERRERKRNGRQ
jgi:hypothetical protein